MSENSNIIIGMIVLIAVITLIIFLVPSQPKICQSNFTCSNWGNCINSQQIRTCSDLNGCPNATIPLLIKSCTNTNTTCTPNIICGSWSNCMNSIKTRTCSDSNNCVASTTENQSCTDTCDSLTKNPDPNCTCPNGQVQESYQDGSNPNWYYDCIDSGETTCTVGERKCYSSTKYQMCMTNGWSGILSCANNCTGAGVCN